MTLPAYLSNRLVVTRLLVPVESPISNRVSRHNIGQAAAIAFTLEAHQRLLLSRDLVAAGVDDDVLVQLDHELQVLDLVRSIEAAKFTQKHNRISA